MTTGKWLSFNLLRSFRLFNPLVADHRYSYVAVRIELVLHVLFPTCPLTFWSLRLLHPFLGNHLNRIWEGKHSNWIQIFFFQFFTNRLHVIASLNHLKFLDTAKVTKLERQMAHPHMPYESQSEPSSLLYRANEDQEMAPTQNTSFGFSRFFTMHWLKKQCKSYSPLPESQERAPKAAYGRLAYKYVGKESEGNRFILNNDLWKLASGELEHFIIFVQNQRI